MKLIPSTQNCKQFFYWLKRNKYLLHLISFYCYKRMKHFKYIVALKDIFETLN